MAIYPPAQEAATGKETRMHVVPTLTESEPPFTVIDEITASSKYRSAANPYFDTTIIAAQMKIILQDEKERCFMHIL